MPWRRWLPHALLGLALLGFGMRFYLALTTIGSNDTPLWHVFATQTRDHGLFATYQQNRLLNHPPLVALWMRIGAGLEGVPFAFWAKVPGLIGEIGTGLLLFRISSAQGTLRGAA